MDSKINYNIVNQEGKILFFGLQDFLEKIVNGDCCFICGAPPGTKHFNNEHVIPAWILKKYHLNSKSIRLPNRTHIRYSNYKVPCCVDCNLNLGIYYEAPLSDLLNKPYKEIFRIITKQPEYLQLLFKWLCLIFFKTHLKDKTLRSNRDLRKDPLPISNHFYWEDMHHIHCIVRSHYTGAVLDSKVFGSMIISPVCKIDEQDSFDYVDTHFGKGVLLRLNDFSIIAVLNDACGCQSIYSDRLSKIKGPLNYFQLRQVVAEMNYLNINLKERPIFYSDINLKGEYIISAKVPELVSLVNEEEELITSGKLLRHFVEESLENLKNKNQILQEIEVGKRGYLFDMEGNFINHDKNVKTLKKRAKNKLD